MVLLHRKLGIPWCPTFRTEVACGEKISDETYIPGYPYLEQITFFSNYLLPFKVNGIHFFIFLCLATCSHLHASSFGPQFLPPQVVLRNYKCFKEGIHRTLVERVSEHTHTQLKNPSFSKKKFH